MTIATEVSSVTYAGDSISTVFAIPFYFIANADLVVTKTTAAGIIPLTLDVDYTLSGAGVSAGGTLTKTTVLATGETLEVNLDPAITQTQHYVSNQAFPSVAVETGFDRLTQVCQRLASRLTRSLHAADGDTITDMELGSVDNRKGKYLFFSAVTGAIEYAANVVTTALSRSIIAQLLNPQTTAESSGGVAPVNYWYAPGVIQRYYSGSGDARTAIQNALNTNALVYSADGWNTTFPVSSYLLVPAGVSFESASLIATANMGNYATMGANHQGQMVVLAGHSSKARTLHINGANFNSGGVLLGGGNAFVDQECSGNFIEKTGTSQAVLDVSAVGSKVFNNTIRYANHGIQSASSIKAAIYGNNVRVIAGGGIWSSDSDRLTITGNTVSDCADVGIDFEGGVDCLAVGNTVEACKNGELTFFQNGSGSGIVPKNLTFRGNTVRRLGTYTTWSGSAEVGGNACNSVGGALRALSKTTGQKGLAFDSNTIYCTGMTAIEIDDLGTGDCGISITGNTVYSDTYLHSVNRADGIIVRGNTFVGLSGAENKENIFKNCSGGVWDNNLYTYNTTKTTNYALRYYTDAAVTTSPTICNNRFLNCAGFAFQHDPFTSATPAIIFGNQFSTAYSANGGVDSTTAGYPLYRGQKLLLSTGASLDLSTVNAMKGTLAIGWGKLMVAGGGVLGATYAVQFSANGPTISSRDGSGSGTGLPTSTTRYASFAGSTITVTAPATAVGSLEVDLSSWS